ncbi:UDP-glucose 4-epimerase GalE [Mycetocola tolaasinivorans]|uniref:UDP-glucose 4-epimerase n=1 Tax=Mycetocola tolaasinivorans TaxID=76635 RepID=A0A3L7A848_9MICO|nr:UDP-glucose 4-epimerase GalE [Mycetocola tolaasinivorans]RLP76000.1 UDP-glucose 4-epimerase GalE [Mycetocola tolaasinivorans]
MRTLVTGGAGFIGAHVVDLLRQRGDDVVIVDDLVTGLAERVPGIVIHEMDIADTASVAPLTELLRAERIDSVIHFAARKQVFESMQRPAWYVQQNLGSLANLLLAMEGAGVRRLVFSSSASVYGTTEGEAIVESDPTVPVNPYGETKLVGEHLVAAAGAAWGLRGVSLRYFNVAGAASSLLGDRAVLNLVPMVFERLDAGESPLVFGGDYPTPDGSCVRDYVHVSDLADAHLATLDDLEQRADGWHDVYNVGTGTGTSVLEIARIVREVTGIEIAPELRPRRAGDPAIVVASAAKIERELGWRARRDITEIIASAWNAHRANSGEHAV